MIMPMDPHTNIVESERLGRTKTYCSQGHRCNPQMQGQLPPDFWTNVNLERGNGINGAGYVQRESYALCMGSCLANTSAYALVTGCIRPEKLSRLNPSDDGGQYSSSGSPTGSACLGYNHYVQLVEPNAARACIRCCKDERDCPTDKGEWRPVVHSCGTSIADLFSTANLGCPLAIPGEYFDCSS